ncbi:MAG: sulfite dehydrogenase [Alphaproteobacteria bacterium]|jgi:sulfane dehydrogenase subunit SoxC|nr:sulfite dehydrogenase [Alphaproteobacteria bacterium]MDP6660984.1 sulfite dehydrogenase [Alphaproteobacteria bacterium]MDP6780222.1 sulfite dehydrogenase [Alphaproteobacteria bacterium]MDP7044323.1 sulfite dehydrogenase [Alphaproteobacteria bacterium]|tara:strand:- start:296 stop:1675 length:1380 start_codon:yes stop_codon:yes gene_type:complete
MSGNDFIKDRRNPRHLSAGGPSADPLPVDLIPVAGGGLLHRRLFLKSGAVLGSAAALGATGTFAFATYGEESATEMPPMPPATPPWMKTPGGSFTNYGRPSPHEKKVIRWITSNQSSPGNGVSWTPLQDLEGVITPNGLHFERHHNGVPAIIPDRHRLLIHGLVARPLTFMVDDLLRYPMMSRLCFVECGGNSNAGWNPRPLQARAGHLHGLASCSEWSGVALSVLLEEAGIDRSRAKWLYAEGADAAAVGASIPVAKAFDDAFVALYQNGERLRPENGYPMRLLIPGWEGVTHIKWLRRLKAVAQPMMSREETSKYTELVPDGTARQFTFVMDAKSLITTPSLGKKMQGPGLYQITGLAWSGRGRIARVEVSADGGESWSEAELQEPVLPHCFTRFRIPWDWQGAPAVLQSRAIDETGSVQPTRQALVTARGSHSYFHYNAIVSWRVSDKGRVSHVYG